MVGHQRIGVQLASETLEPSAQALRVSLTIIIVEKTWKTIVSSLHHVLRNASEIVSWRPSHARNLDSSIRPGRQAKAAHRHHLRSRFDVRNCPWHRFLHLQLISADWLKPSGEGPGWLIHGKDSLSGDLLTTCGPFPPPIGSGLYAFPKGTLVAIPPDRRWPHAPHTKHHKRLR